MSSELSVNGLLRLLDADTRTALSLVPVQLRYREVLYEPRLPALYAYFPLSAVVSLVSTMEDGTTAEVAVVGREGMVGLASILGRVETPAAAVVQIPGTALRTSTALLRGQRLRIPAVRTALDLYTEAHLIQVAQTAACNSLHPVEARLARWLLDIADRIAGDHFTLPQELMAQMLGVHRPTLSNALRNLRSAGGISYRGRTIVVINRATLERSACECYGVLRREFDRLLRPPITDVDSLAQTPASAGAGAGTGTAAQAMRQVAGRLLLATIREQEARDAAEAANRAKDQFLAMVSHELRTPLNAIVGWCDILAKGHAESIERGLPVIQRNALTLMKLVEDLLDASRLTSDSMSIRTSPASLTDIVRGAIDSVTPTANTKGISLRSTLSTHVLTVLADTDRLRQVFLNVLSNALKFTDRDGTINVTTSIRGACAVVSICDTGQGIATDSLPHVFERFKRGTNVTAVQPGLGLGLTIARVLIERHGGTIQIASCGEGQGTTCTIELPLAATEAVVV